MKKNWLAVCAATMTLCAVSAAAAANRTASVITIWRISGPQASDASVQPVEAGIVALNVIAPQLTALERHPGAKVTFAVDPIYVNALEKAASGQSVLAAMSSGGVSSADQRATQLLDVLSVNVVPATQYLDSPAGRRFAANASQARSALLGQHAAHFSSADDTDFAATGLLLSLVSSGYSADLDPLLRKNTLSAHDLQTVAQSFERSCRDVLDRTKKAAQSGSIELAAMPAYEPIMPLVINAAGRSRRVPYTVNLDATADVSYAIDEGLRTVRALDPSRGAPGLVSPNGAYNDETAVLMQARGAAYGVFSDRVVKANSGASAQAVSDVHSAAYRAYLFESSKTSRLPIFFSSDTAGMALDSQPPFSPAPAMADKLDDAVNAALAATNTGPTLFVVCLNANAAVFHRPDRAAVLEDFIALLAGGGTIRAVTPRDYLRSSPPTSFSYGYAPASDVGGFDLWMGSANQMSLWNALDAARKAAGGDLAVTKASTREPLLEAEGGRWFVALALPLPRPLTDRSLAQYRSLIAQIYRGAGQSIPGNIAPVTAADTGPAANTSSH